MKKISLLVLLVNSSVICQDSVYILTPVEITGARSQVSYFQSFGIADSNEISKGERGISLEESLSGISGLIINDRNNASLGDKILIRGIGSRSSFGIRGIKIISDNIPLTLPDGQSQTNNIDLSSAGDIKIFKGPASSLYGNSAGGVINIRSEIPSAEAVKITPGFTFGEHDLQKYTLKLSGTVRDHSYLLSFNKINYSGFREHSARSIYQLNLLYRYAVSGDIGLSAVINYFNSPYLLNPGSLDKKTSEEERSSAREFVKQQGSGEKADQVQAGITFTMNGNNFVFETTPYLLSRSLINPIPGRIINLKRITGGIRTAVKKIPGKEYPQLVLSGGADLEFQNDRRKEFENNGLPHPGFTPSEIFDNLDYGSKIIDQNESVLGFGPFLTAEFFLNKRVGLSAGLRYDFYRFKVDDYFTGNPGEREMKQWSPAAGIFFKPNSYSRFFLNYATSFQTPTTSELSNRPDIQGGFNPDLNPERLYQLEFGSEYFLEGIRTLLSAALFVLYFEDLLIPYENELSEEIFFRNAGKAENKGVELSAELFLSEYLRFQGSYTFMNFFYKDYAAEYNRNTYQLEGNRVPGVPKQVYSLGIEYFAHSGFWGKLKFFWSDKYFTNDFNGTPPGSSSERRNFINDSYLKGDLRIGIKFQTRYISPDLFAGVNNFLNEKYNGSVVPNFTAERYFEPAPGRTWYAGFTIEFLPEKCSY